MSRFSLFKKITSSKNQKDFFHVLALPLVCITAITFVIIVLNFYTAKSQAESNARSSLISFSKYCEYKVSSLIDSALLFESNTEVNRLLDKTDRFTESETTAVEGFLNYFKNINPIIETVGLLSEKSDTVITCDSSCSIAEYFDRDFVIENYNSDYFRSFRIFDSSKYKLLPPSQILSENNSGAVITLLIKEMSQKHKNTIFIAISLDKLFNSDRLSQDFSDDAQIYILNNYSRYIYTPQNSLGTDIADKSLYEKLMRGLPSFKSTTDSGKACLVFSFSPLNSILDYTYYVKIPYSDLYRDIYIVTILTVLLSFIAICYALFLQQRNSEEIFTSLKNVSHKLNNNQASDQPLLPSITDSINHLKEKYDNLLPYVQEKYIIELMTGKETPKNSMDEISDELFPFKKRYFLSTIIQISPTNKLLSVADEFAPEQLMSEIIEIMKMIWRDNTDAFFISSEKNTLYALINTDDQEICTLRDRVLADITDLLRNDQDLINLIIGKGTLEEGASALRISHQNAVNSLTSVLSPTIIKIPRKNAQYLSYKIESGLFVLLIEGDTGKAIELITDIVTQSESSSDTDRKQIYSEILDTVFRALRSKKIALPHGESEYDIRQRIMSSAPENIHREILVLINSFVRPVDNNVSIDSVIQYIKEHYHNPSLSLDMLSENFGPDSKYLSAAIKNTLGIGFHDYLTNLRVNRAKELLGSHELSLGEVLELSGFTNRQTFSRIFKKITGQTPSDYRKNSRK